VKSDKNGECLVAVCETRGKRALLPGDYCYERMSIDTSGGMQPLLTAPYDAVVVPHHGDKASAHEIVSPVSDNSIAFFSAGDHSYYKHPTVASLARHKSKGFLVVNKHEMADIRSQQLLP
jgi:beta-lactamase superfamily II metal-dependent hydrolase